MEQLIAGLVGAVVGIGLGLLFDRMRMGAMAQRKEEILKQAEKEADNLRKELELTAKEELLKRREELEKDLNESRDELRQQERRLDKRESSLDDQHEDYLKKERMLETTQTQLAERGKAMDAKEKELDRALREEQDQLYKISSLDKETATSMLLDRLGQQLRDETGDLILKHRQEVEQQCERQAQEIISMSVQRCAAEHTSEMTVSTVDIPSDEMKGRIIGREGRNIRAFEKASGVDVIVDDTPGVVVVSAFDKVRREIARLSLEKLIKDGRIHPTRIDEVVTETEKEMDAHIQKLGQEACQEIGISGLHEKLVYLMGRLHFRSSYSQNVLKHSIEVSHLSGLMAEQLGLDGTLARRCGFLHDIGKAADHEMEGGHPAVGAELLKRYNEGPEVVHAAAGHHDDIRVDYIYTVLVASADACSAGRPGARRETLERYVRRLEELEALANGFPGVHHCFAVQAGREIRVIVDAQQLNDREAAKVSRDIAKAIEETLTYPGEVKVTVLRETRVISIAK